MKFKIQGIKQIQGTIDISGSKNACLPMIAGALLSREEIVLQNVPLITDIVSMIRILDSLGVNVNYMYEKKVLIIHANKIKNDLTSPYVAKLRASYYLISPLIHRKKEFESIFPGGCNFGKRPIDLHLKLYKEMGIDIVEDEKLHFKRKRLKPINITFPIITVGGTINAILSTVLIKGETIVSNIAIEPEVIDVINFLKSMGADITFIGERTITIKGVKKLHKTVYKVMPDRIEAGSYMFLALAKPNSKITIQNININDLKNIIDILQSLGSKLNVHDNSLEIISPEIIQSINLSTGPYPMFPTDLQPLLSTVLLQSNGKSTINETIYPSRDSHVKELIKMKGNISMSDGIISIMPSDITNGIVNAYDLRCGFALIIAGIIAKNQTIINNAEYILRGYENITYKLSKLEIKCKKE